MASFLPYFCHHKIELGMFIKMTTEDQTIFGSPYDLDDVKKMISKENMDEWNIFRDYLKTIVKSKDNSAILEKIYHLAISRNNGIIFEDLLKIAPIGLLSKMDVINEIAVYNRPKLAKIYIEEEESPNVGLLDNAVAYNRIEMLKLFNKYDFTKKSRHTFYFESAVKRGNIEILKFLHSKYNQTYDKSFIGKCMNIAVEYGRLDSLKYLRSIGARLSNDLVRVSVQFARDDITSYLLKEGNFSLCVDLDKFVSSLDLQVERYMTKKDIKKYLSSIPDRYSEKYHDIEFKFIEE